jgi:type II secretory pathway pseudopilin PulG
MFTKQWLIDVAERTFWTFVETFLSIVLVAGVANWDISTLRAAGLSALAAALAVVKGAIASARAGTISPASTAKPA